MPILPVIGGIAKLLGGLGRGAGQDRESQNRFIQGENDRAASMYGTEQGARINLANLGEASTRDRADRRIAAPQARARQALVSQLLRNFQPRSLSGLPPGVSIPRTGGGMADALRRSPQAHQALQLLTDDALKAMITGSDVPAVADTSSPLMRQPPMQTYRQPGRGESIMGAIGLGGNVLDVLGRGGVFNRRPGPGRDEYEDQG